MFLKERYLQRWRLTKSTSEKEIIKTDLKTVKDETIQINEKNDQKEEKVEQNFKILRG